jgi:hypothetical protein
MEKKLALATLALSFAAADLNYASAATRVTTTC